MSRALNENTECSLSLAIFLKIMKHYWLLAETDLFATYSNKKIPRYVLWHQENFPYTVDAFNLQNVNFYAFPAFNLIGKSISKIIREQALGIRITPYWPIQNFFPLMTFQSRFQQQWELYCNHKEAAEHILLYKNDSPRSPFIWTTIQASDLPDEIGEVICNSWKTKSKQQYEGVL